MVPNVSDQFRNGHSSLLQYFRIGMKKLIFVIMFSLSTTVLFSQIISYDDFQGLIPYLQTENWKRAFKTSSKLLVSTESDTTDLKAIVMYMNIYSAAGLVSQGKMTYDELEKKIMKFQGQKIVMPSHPITKNTGSLNCLHFSVADSTNEASIASTNEGGLNILCFEYFYFNDKQNPERFGNAMVRCGGILDKIELNPNKSKIWILRLRVTNAFARTTN